MICVGGLILPRYATGFFIYLFGIFFFLFLVPAGIEFFLSYCPPYKMEFCIRLCRGRKRALTNKVEEGNGKLESHFMFLLSPEFCNKLDKTVVSFLFLLFFFFNTFAI